MGGFFLDHLMHLARRDKMYLSLTHIVFIKVNLVSSVGALDYQNGVVIMAMWYVCCTTPSCIDVFHSGYRKPLPFVGSINALICFDRTHVSRCKVVKMVLTDLVNSLLCGVV